MKHLLIVIFLIYSFNTFAEKGRSSDLPSCTKEMSPGFFLCIEYVGSMWHEAEMNKDQKDQCKEMGSSWTDNRGCNTAGVWGTAYTKAGKGGALDKKVYFWFGDKLNKARNGSSMDKKFNECNAQMRKYIKHAASTWSGSDCNEFFSMDDD